MNRFRRRRPDATTSTSPSPAMSPEEFVRALYVVCLGREADPGGLSHWVDQLIREGDPTAVLAGIMTSAEARRLRGATFEECRPLAERALKQLNRHPRIVDIGAQLIGDGTHAYTPLTSLTPLDVIGFDPLAERMTERAATESAGNGSLTLLPYAIGDGRSHTLHINNDDATSSLFALNLRHNSYFNHLSTLHTVDTEILQTRPLDQALDPGKIDFLKLDIQGGELMVLEGAARSLAETAVVHCEVEFSPIYEGQPLYPAIQTELAKYGFFLVDFVDPGRYHYLTESGTTGDERLLWADAVFFRETDEPETLAAQALIAAAVYKRPSLAEHLLGRATGG